MCPGEERIKSVVFFTGMKNKERKKKERKRIRRNKCVHKTPGENDEVEMRNKRRILVKQRG